MRIIESFDGNQRNDNLRVYTDGKITLVHSHISSFNVQSTAQVRFTSLEGIAGVAIEVGPE